MSNLDFKCALITGGGGGIGKALAEYFISKGKKVLLAGRTESKIRDTAKEIGATGYYVFDTGKAAGVPAFVKKITQEHPDLDCLVNNAGVQRELHPVTDAANDMLEKADEEIDINIRGPMHLAVRLLPHFQRKPSAVIVNVSSVLGFAPTNIINPVYNGTKAWLHSWSMALRTQLAQQGSNIRVVEIAPPSVGTDLHRDREDPDDNKKHKNPEAMTVEEFMDEIAGKIEKGDAMIAAGPANKIIDKWYESFGDFYKSKVGGADEEIRAKAQK